MDLEQSEKNHAVSRRSVGPRARLELAQRPGILVRRAAIPDCDHGRDHVLRVGEQSALPHDREPATASAGQAAAQSRPERRISSGQSTGASPEAPRFDGLDKLFARAGQQVPDWTTISLRLPNTASDTLTFSIDRGNGGRPDLRSQLTLDPATGEIVRWEPFSSYNRGRQLRAWARFTHTGEAGGLPGQTIAVIASAGASCWYLPALARRCDGWLPGRQPGSSRIKRV